MAGDVCDTATLEKVEREPDIYTLPEAYGIVSKAVKLATNYDINNLKRKSHGKIQCKRPDLPA